MTSSLSFLGLFLGLALIAWCYDLAARIDRTRLSIATLIETVNQQGDGLRDHLEVHDEQMERIADALEDLERRVA